MKHITKLASICAASFLLSSFSAMTLAAESAGNVIRVTGTASMKDSTGKTTTLTTGAAVNVGDTVTTSKGASVQLQMKDGAIVALAADSEFKVKSYNYQEKGGKKDNVSLNLQKGRLRTITGSTPKTAYGLTTPAAIVRIHGTTYDVLANDSTTVILREGAVEVESLCDGAGTGNIQMIDVPGTATEIAPCQPPKEPEPTTEEVADLNSMLPPNDPNDPCPSCLPPPCTDCAQPSP